MPKTYCPIPTTVKSATYAAVVRRLRFRDGFCATSSTSAVVEEGPLGARLETTGTPCVLRFRDGCCATSSTSGLPCNLLNLRPALQPPQPPRWLRRALWGPSRNHRDPAQCPDRREASGRMGRCLSTVTKRSCCAPTSWEKQIASSRC